MKRAFFLLAICAILCACEKQSQTIRVDFDYKRETPLMVSFTNLSSGADAYRWDFGDGMWSQGYDAIHEYETTGEYVVTLTATIGGIKYDKQTTIAIDEPDAYIAGYTLYRIPYENRYYKVVFKDDALLPSSWDFQTQYTPMLDASDLPYTARLLTPRLFENIDAHEYYTVQVVRNTSTSNASGDASCMKQRLEVKDIKQYQPEYILRTETNSTAIGIIMQYEY